MHSRRLHVQLEILLIASTILAACGADVPENQQSRCTVDSAARGIIGGQPEVAYAAVGALKSNGEAFCTGTLVSPRVVVTAAHCVEGPTAAISFFIGADASQPGAEIPVQSVHPHSAYATDKSSDIAVLRLAQPAGVTPIPYMTTAFDSSYIGRSVLFIGYGLTNVSGEGLPNTLKNSVSIKITGLPPEGDENYTYFRYDEPMKNTCNGDSGGPGLLEIGGKLQLVGVTAFGDETCTEFGYNTRVDLFASFIDEHVRATGGTSDTATANAPTSDNVTGCE